MAERKASTPLAGRALDELDRRFATGAVLVAAGQSLRMGATNKLLAEIDGRPMVACVADTAFKAGVTPLIVVTGHDAERVRAALRSPPAEFVHNPDYADGMGSSLARGIDALRGRARAAFILLGDMPFVRAEDLRALRDAIAPEQGRLISVPVRGGRRGNPVLFAARFFPALGRLRGDQGARALLRAHPHAVAEVPLLDDGLFLDVDTPEALRDARHRVER